MSLVDPPSDDLLDAALAQLGTPDAAQPLASAAGIFHGALPDPLSQALLQLGTPPAAVPVMPAASIMGGLRPALPWRVALFTGALLLIGVAVTGSLRDERPISVVSAPQISPVDEPVPSVALAPVAPPITLAAITPSPPSPRVGRRAPRKTQVSSISAPSSPTRALVASVLGDPDPDPIALALSSSEPLDGEDEDEIPLDLPEPEGLVVLPTDPEDPLSRAAGERERIVDPAAAHGIFRAGAGITGALGGWSGLAAAAGVAVNADLGVLGPSAGPLRPTALLSLDVGGSPGLGPTPPRLQLGGSLGGGAALDFRRVRIDLRWTLGARYLAASRSQVSPDVPIPALPFVGMGPELGLRIGAPGKPGLVISGSLLWTRLDLDGDGSPDLAQWGRIGASFEAPIHVLR